MHKDSVLVVQLGARRNYAVPAAFEREGRLAALYTDLCVGSGTGRLASLIRPFPHLAKRLNLERRTPSPSVLARTTTFPAWFWEMRQALSLDSSSTERLYRIREVHDRAANRMLKQGFRGASHVYGMFGEVTTLFEAAKDSGLTTILDVNISPSTEAIVAQEQSRYPGWEPPRLYYGQAAAGSTQFPPIMDRILPATDIFVCPSEFVRNDLINNFGVPFERTRLVPYLVADKWFSVSVSPVPGRVLFAGTAELRKGIHTLAEASHILRDRGRSYEFLVAGHSRPQIRQRAECSELTFLGSLDASRMSQVFASADMLVLPSLADGSAGVTYEAIGCGIPVITTNEAGSVVRHMQDGLIIPSRDAPALADAIESIAQNRKLRTHMSINAAQRAKEFGQNEFGTRLNNAVFGLLPISIAHT